MINTRCSTSSYSPTYKVIRSSCSLFWLSHGEYDYCDTWYVHFSTDLIYFFRFVSKITVSPIQTSRYCRAELKRIWPGSGMTTEQQSGFKRRDFSCVGDRKKCNRQWFLFGMGRTHRRATAVAWHRQGPALPSALAELIRETFKRHGM